METDAILNTAQTLIVVFNRQGEIQRFNRTCETVSGYSAAEVIGQPVWAFLLVPAARLAMQAEFDQLLKGQTDTYFQNTWLDKSGRRHVIAWSNTVLCDEHSEVEFVVASGVEIRTQSETHLDRKEPSKEPWSDPLDALVEARTIELSDRNQQLHRELSDRAQAELALRRREAKMRLVTNALPALVAYIDTYHRYRFNNYAYESWYGIPYRQITGRQVNEIVEPAVYQQMLPYLEQALAGEKVAYEAEMILNGGQRLWASISYSPDVQGGRVKGLVSLISDISAHKAAEQMKDEFVSVVSHELRTPLTSIHGSLKLLATGKLGHLPSQGQTLIDIALSNTDRLTRLINDVLDLERMGSGRVRMVPENCSASALVHSAAQSMQSMADEYGIRFSLQLPPDYTPPEKTPQEKTPPEKTVLEKTVLVEEETVHNKAKLETTQPDPEPLTVWADADHILQALTNLLSNAIKFSPRGATVTLRVRSLKNNIEFLVKDCGRGIPSDKLETIFERFAQVDTSDARERGGTGLGLAICREIVQQHQGRIWVKSVHSQGSSFYFTLPKKQPTTSDSRPVPSTASASLVNAHHRTNDSANHHESQTNFDD